MMKVLQPIFILVLLSLNTSANNPGVSHAVGDISIKSLFEMHEEFLANYKKSDPSDLLNPELFRGVEIYMLFGTWCHDSKREVPRLLSLLNKLDVPENQINLIGLNFKKNDSQDRGKKFQIKKTPTFVFLRNQKEIGRIVEMPEISLEADLLKILGSLD